MKTLKCKEPNEKTQSLRGQTHNSVKIKYRVTCFIQSRILRLNQCLLLIS